MKRVLVFLFFFILVFLNKLDAQSSGDYRSAITGNWGSTTTWETYNGSSWVGASVVPTTTNAGIITVRNGHVVTIAATTTVDQTIIEAGGTLNLTAAMTVANGTGTDLTVDGTLKNSYSSAHTITGTITVNNLYQHNISGGTIPAATWSTNSTCEIIGWAGTTSAPGGLGQSFYHFKWNSPSHTANLNLSGNLKTINGDFTVASMSTGELGFTGATAITVTVLGNFTVQAGKVLLERASSNTGSIWNVSGNLNISGGSFILGSNTGTNATMNVAGDLNLTGGTLDFTTSGGSGMTNVINLSGNFNMSGSSTLDRTGTATASSFNLNFAKSGLQSFVKSAGTIAAKPINFTVNSGSTVDFGTYILGGSTGTFTVSSGGGIKIGSTVGITTSGTTGNIQVTGTRSYSTGANYEYNGSSGQVTGNGLPATVNNLTISNAAGVTLSGSYSVTGTANITGTLICGNNTISGGTFTLASGATLKTGNTAGITTSGATGSVQTTTRNYHVSANYEYNGSAEQVTGDGLPAAVNNLTINNSLGVSLSGATSVSGALALTSGAFSIGANTLTLDGAISGPGTLTGGASSNITFGGSGVSTALPSVSLNNLTINRANGISLGGATTVDGTLTLTNGALSLGSNTLSINGAISGSGTLTGGASSNITFGGSGASTTLPSVSLNNLTINRANGISLGGATTVGGTLTLTNGALGIGANTLTLNGAITGSGTLTGGASSNITFGGSTTTTLPSVTLQNLTQGSSGTITIGGATTVNNAVNLNAGSLDAATILTVGESGSINYNGGAITNYSGVSNVTLSSSGTYTLGTVKNLSVDENSTLGAGITVNGNVTVAATKTINGGTDLVHTIKGNWTNNGILNAGTSKFIFNGSTPQTMYGSTWYDLEINNPAGVTMTTDEEVTHSLILTNGAFSIGAHTLTLNGIISQTSGSITGGGSSNIVFGGSSSTTLPIVSGGWNSLTQGSTGVITQGGAISTSGTTTVNSGCTFASGSSVFTSDGTVTINGSFRIDQGGWATGSGTWTYGSGGTLIFNNSSGSYGVNNSDVFWPNSSGPVNVNVLGSGGITLNASRTVSGTFQTAATVTNASNLTLDGTAQLNGGGSFGSAPTYGGSSTLVYNTGLTYGRYNEWSSTSPANITLQNSTTLNYPNGSNAARSITGNLTIGAGSALYMDYGSPSMNNALTVGGNVTVAGSLSLGDAAGGDLYIGGNWVNNGATLNLNTREIKFNGSSAQSIGGTSSTTFDYLKIDNAAGVTFNAATTINNNLTVNTGKTLNGGTALTHTLKGNWSNSGTFNCNTSKFVMNGSSAQTMSGSTFYDLEINNSNGVTMLTDETVTHALTMTSGNLNTGSYTVYLESTATLYENYSGSSIVNGNIQTTRTVNKGDNPNNFGGLGFDWFVNGSSTNDPGTTTLLRVTGTALTGNGAESIKRYFVLTPTNTTGIKAKMVFHYSENSGITELNGKTESNLRVWRKVGADWGNGNVITGSVNTTDNTVAWDVNYAETWPFNWETSTWTLAEAGSALPAELMTFISVPQGRNIQLEWNTATEVNTSIFAVERSQDKLNWLRVGKVDASGYSNAPRDYSFTDKMLNTGKYSYRLKIIDNDGTFEYSPVIEAEVSVPAEFAVSQNYPNPFNPSTKINYDIPEDSRIVLSLYGIAGEKVAELVNGEVPAGYYTHQLDMNGYNLSSGIYFYKLVGSSLNGERKYNVVRKMMYLR